MLKQLTDAVIQDKQIAETQKQEALQVVTEIAKQAKAEPKERSLGTLKAVVAGLHAVVSGSNDLLTLWDKGVPLVKHFFGI
jgi:hypothetical protein